MEKHFHLKNSEELFLFQQWDFLIGITLFLFAYFLLLVVSATYNDPKEKDKNSWTPKRVTS